VVRAGTLNRRVTIQARTDTQNAMGEVTWAWTDVATVWAAIEPMNIKWREYFEARQMQSSADIRVRIRYRRGITTKHRVKYVEDGSPEYTHYYEIEAALPPKQGRSELHLMCKERDEDGWRN
jgi:SPP1 family predicted phage head-tail adaptor